METKEKTSAVIVKETTVNVPVEKVWKAITDPSEMQKWYFDIPDFKAEVGHKFQFWGGDENTKYLHLCKIIEVVPEKKLSYTWTYEGFAVESIVTFELFEAAGAGNDKTRVRLTHVGVEKFPTKDKNFARDSFVAGWEYIIGTSLKEHFEKKS